MAYFLTDVNKQRADGPSINGLREIKTLLQEYKPRPALEQLLQHGVTNKLAALANDCRNLANKTTEEPIKNSLLSIAAFALKAKEIVVLEH